MGWRQISQGRASAPVSDKLDFWFKDDAELFVNLDADQIHQLDDLGSGRLAVVDDEIGVLVADAGLAYPCAFQPGCLDEATGEVASRVFENRTGAFIGGLRTAAVIGVGFGSFGL